MRHLKVAIIGAGAVGSTTAYALMLKNIAAEIILVDINQKRCKGEVLDLTDALSFSDTSIVRSTSFSEAKDANIIIITAGVAQKPGQTRSELASTNKKIINSIIQELQPINKASVIIVVSNPVDAMTFFVQQASGLPYNQVIGTGTFLDTQRLRSIISEKLHIAEQSIHAYILGEHGDSQFVAWSTAQVGGAPIVQLPSIDKSNLELFAQQTRNKVYEIINNKGATFFGIAACVSALCENIFFDQNRIAPVSTFIQKFGLYLSLPAVIGNNGIKQTIEIPLNQKEQQQMEKSVKKIQTIIDAI